MHKILQALVTEQLARTTEMDLALRHSSDCGWMC